MKTLFIALIALQAISGVYLGSGKQENQLGRDDALVAYKKENTFQKQNLLKRERIYGNQRNPNRRVSRTPGARFHSKNPRELGPLGSASLNSPNQRAKSFRNSAPRYNSNIQQGTGNFNKRLFNKQTSNNFDGDNDNEDLEDEIEILDNENMDGENEGLDVENMDEENESEDEPLPDDITPPEGEPDELDLDDLEDDDDGFGDDGEEGEGGGILQGNFQDALLGSGNKKEGYITKYSSSIPIFSTFLKNVGVDQFLKTLGV